MSDNQTPLDLPLWAVRGRLALAALTIISAVGVLSAVVGFARQPRAPAAFAVLDVRMTTTIVSTSPQAAERSVGESWTAPPLGRVREAPVSPPGPADYYVRSHSGVWTYVAYDATGLAGRWRRGAAPSAPPTLLDEQQVDALFMRLRARAGATNVSRVAMGDRMAATFTTRALSWPYRYNGLARVWIDDVTGQPRQIRIMTRRGAAAGAILTTIDSMRTVSASSFPADFFTPPDEPMPLWDRVTRWLP